MPIGVPPPRIRMVKAIATALLAAAAYAGCAHAASAPTVLVSRPEPGGAASANGSSYHTTISGTGRFVTFMSLADNLVPRDSNQQYDIFVRDVSDARTLLVSRPSGTTGFSNGRSSWPAIAAGGRFVAFQSFATNLVDGDHNGHADVFVRDLRGLSTRVVSRANGAFGNGDSLDPAISRNGRFIAFQSFAGNLVPGDDNARADVFLRDMRTGSTRLVSRPTAAGAIAAGGDSDNPAMSPDGRFIAFESSAGNLAGRDTNGVEDVFVRDVKRGTTRLVSRARDGATGNGPSYMASISANGRYIAFASRASNLVASDDNGAEDVFVRDMRTGRTTLVSPHANGGTSARTIYPSLSGDGQLVAFHSDANDIVPGDRNGVGDVFVRDLRARRTVLLSAGGDAASDDYSGGPAMSADGRYVAYASLATNLVDQFSGHHANIFRTPVP